MKTLAKSAVNIDKLNSKTLGTYVRIIKQKYKKTILEGKWKVPNMISIFAICHRFPRMYRQLQNQLPLPKKKSVYVLLNSMPIEPGLNMDLIQLLKKVSKDIRKEDKYCVLLFDSIKLCKHLDYNIFLDRIEGYEDFGPGKGMGRTSNFADSTLVFMIQGINMKIKQPLAYYFVDGIVPPQKLAKIIRNVINAVHQTDFTILTTVCSHSPSNIAALDMLKILGNLSPEENFFYFKQKKVYIIFDIPDLFRSLCDNFYESQEITYDNKIAKWSHLFKAEEMNTKLSLNFMKITSNVVHRKYKSRRNVKYAAHALSNTMAAILKSINWGEEDEEFKETAYVIGELDKLFDVCNGPSSPEGVKKGIRTHVSKTSNHIEQWNYYLTKLGTINMLKSDSRLRIKNIRCIKGFTITLKSLKDVWTLLNSTTRIRVLNLRQLNKDALRSLFDVIREHNVMTCADFRIALKYILFSKLTKPDRQLSCEHDKNKFIFDFSDLLKDVSLTLPSKS